MNRDGVFGKQTGMAGMYGRTVDFRRRTCYNGSTEKHTGKGTIMDNAVFSPIEESVSFYTRNDFAIMNNLLTGHMDALWEHARVAYEDNRCIIREYENGERTMDSDYDVKWLNILKKRLITELDEETKARILETAKSDIANLLGAMIPAETEMRLYRTAWVAKEYEREPVYPYSLQYRAMDFRVGEIVEIRSITSASLTPYREDEDVGSDFWRYEITVPQGNPVLPLDVFVCHNEEGEVLLPPMKCRITGILPCGNGNTRCRGIITLEYLERLEVTV